MPSMEIHSNSPVNLARCRRCTNANSISTRSYGCVEFENVNPHSVQKTNYTVRACKELRLLKRRTMPTMEIHSNSRVNLARRRCCTNANSISTRSHGCVEFENVNSHSVQKAHHAVRACKELLLQRRTTPSTMEIHANSRVNLARCRR